MDFLQPRTLDEALRMRAERPDAVIVAGGTDVLVALNFDRMRPPAVLDLGRVGELRDITVADGVVRVGAGATYHDVIERLGATAPALAQAARSVGSPQVRNRGTVGGNLGTASPAGDCHPPLLASRADVELASTAGSRTVPAREFFVGPKRSVLRADELIAGVRLPVASGPQHFAKVGTRNAMVIAVCSFALAFDDARRSVGTGIGSAGPVPLVADEAEAFLTGALDRAGFWDRPRQLPASVVDRFGDLVAGAARPMDDVRGTAVYREHALRVLARRLLTWACDDARKAAVA